MIHWIKTGKEKSNKRTVELMFTVLGVVVSEIKVVSMSSTLQIILNAATSRFDGMLVRGSMCRGACISGIAETRKPLSGYLARVAQLISSSSRGCCLGLA